MKTIIAILLLLVACSPEKQTPIIKKEKRDLSIYADSAYKLCEKKDLNKVFYFLIDLKKHSGQKRFYVWDFKKNCAVDTFMVSHGCGQAFWKTSSSKTNPSISNEPDSHCSSVGRYLVEERGKSKFGIGIKYNLTGLDKTNNNARKRAIVLHGWEEVEDHEIYPEGTSEGWGCPAVSNNSMKELDKLLKTTKENTLMWIIN